MTTCAEAEATVTVQCPQCGRTFRNLTDVLAHSRRSHEPHPDITIATKWGSMNCFICSSCGLPFSNRRGRSHKCTQEPIPRGNVDCDNVRRRPRGPHPRVLHVVTYAHYECVADCADAMADAWEDTAGCAQPVCLHENLLK